MFTIQQYMNNEITHQQYYGQFVDEHITRLVLDTFESEILTAVFRRDKDFNPLPLRYWDALSATIARKVSPLLREAGDFYSLAGGVCILKQAARMHVEAKEKNDMTLGTYINQLLESGAGFMGIVGKGIECDLIQAAAHIASDHWNHKITSLFTDEDKKTCIWLENIAGEPTYIIAPTR